MGLGESFYTAILLVNRQPQNPGLTTHSEIYAHGSASQQQVDRSRLGSVGSALLHILHFWVQDVGLWLPGQGPLTDPCQRVTRDCVMKLSMLPPGMAQRRVSAGKGGWGPCVPPVVGTVALSLAVALSWQ